MSVLPAFENLSPVLEVLLETFLGRDNFTAGKLVALATIVSMRIHTF